MQMYRSDHNLSGGKPTQPLGASFWETCKPAAAFPKCPLEKRIVAPPDNGWSGRPSGRCGSEHRCDPAVEGSPWEKPFACHLRARDRSLRHKLIKLALGETQVVCGLICGQKLMHRNRYEYSCSCYIS